MGKSPIDPEIVRVLPTSDVLVIGLGWLFSLHGFVFLAFCLMGSWTGVQEISRSLNNAPIEISRGTLNGASDGRNVRVRGTIDPTHLVVGKKTYGTAEFTLVPLRDPEPSLCIYIPARLPDEVIAHPVERWYEGELIILDHGSGKIDGHYVPVKSLFRDTGLELPDVTMVVADSIIPTFHWWYLLLTGSCLSGLLYIAYRVLWGLVFVFNRDAAVRFLLRR